MMRSLTDPRTTSPCEDSSVITRPARLLAVAVVACALLAGCGEGGFLGRETPYPALDADSIRSSTDAVTGLTWVSVDNLPATAQAALTLIDAGDTDSTSGPAFVDEAGLLPVQPAGYYRAYEVPNPDATGPTPWHLVVGERGEVFWTANDFDTLRRVGG